MSHEKLVKCKTRKKNCDVEKKIKKKNEMM